MRTFSVETGKREAIYDVTGKVASAVADSGVGDGLCVVFVPHTTAAVTINENADPDVMRDIVSFTSQLIPQNHPFRHAEGNSDAHIKASFFGSSVTVPVTGGRLALGTWQGIQFCEFDGPRSRKFHVQVIGGAK